MHIITGQTQKAVPLSVSEPKMTSIGELLMDIQVSVNLMSQQSEARRTLIRCAMALAHLGKLAAAETARANAAEALAAKLEAL
jgi:hypothetical protein